jgi:ubiquitin conjugation factor E4 B
LTLKEEGQRDIHGKRTYLPGLRSELQDEGKELRIQISNLDQALLEAASQAEKNRPLDYLLPCWKRITKLYKGLRRTGDSDPKYQVLCEARRLCMSYCIFAITMPEMFGCVFLRMMLHWHWVLTVWIADANCLQKHR